MTFPNLANIISEEAQGDYSFEHIDKDGYNTLYFTKLNKVIMYDMVNRPIKNIFEQHMNNLTGDVLICGLGCGFSIFPIKDLPTVKSITVIENDATIIAMMQPYLEGVTIIEADATMYKPLQTYDSILLDIWEHENNDIKYNETIRYYKYLNTGGYLNYVDFRCYCVIKLPYNDNVIYRIEEDVNNAVLLKGVTNINYITELNTLVSYTPEYIIHDTGVKSGLLDKTNYYRGYIDLENKGELILVVEEVYNMDTSDNTLNNSGNPPINRTKTRKYVKKDGTLDEVNTKIKSKKYNTRRKRHKEGIKRRENIKEQLIDNVGLASILSGIFISESDVHEKLTLLLEKHSSAFDAWQQSSRGTLYNDLLNDFDTTWLSNIISNETNQPEPQRTVIAPIEFTSVAHMMDISLRTYIISKLKGDIK